MESERAALMAAAALLLSACAGEERAAVDAATCGRVLESFSTVPIQPQTREQKIEFIEFTRSEQERSFAASCERIPEWRTRFDSAYREALDAAASSVIEVDIIEPDRARTTEQE